MSEKTQEAQEKRVDDDFIRGYDASIQRAMVLDQSRTRAYCDAIVANRSKIANAVVLDVGSGSGLLSMLCCKHGFAKHVVAVEGNKEIAEASRKIIQRNRMQVINGLLGPKHPETTKEVNAVLSQYDDTRIKRVGASGTASDVTGKASVVISEWMGHFLIFERMIDTVLFAREQFASSDCIMLPHHATLFVCGIYNPYIYGETNRLENVLGLDMRELMGGATMGTSNEIIAPGALQTNATPILDLDLYKAEPSDLDIYDRAVSGRQPKQFSLQWLPKSSTQLRLNGLCSFFVVEFPSDGAPNRSPAEEKAKTPPSTELLKLSTGPQSAYTHWHQTTLYFNRTLGFADTRDVQFRLSCQAQKRSHRSLDIQIEVQETSDPGEEYKHRYLLGSIGV